MALTLVSSKAPVQTAEQQAESVRVTRLIAVVRDARTPTIDAASAIRELGALGPRAAPAVPAILDRVLLESQRDANANTDDRDLPGVPMAAADAMWRIGPTVLPQLKRALRTRCALVRWVAIEAISGFEDRDVVSAIPDLKRVVVDTWSDPASRLTPETDAAKAIASLGGLSTLTDLLGEERADVRMSVLQALPSYSGPKDELAPLLLKGLQDKRRLVRQYAISAVRRITPVHPDVRTALQAVARTDPDARTREIADEALKAMREGR